MFNRAVASMALLLAGTTLALAELQVGVGKRVLTPDPLLPVSGGIGPGRPADRKLGDLYARVMVLQEGENQVAFVAVDFLGFPAVLGDRVRAMVPEIPPEHILIGASHTHSAPDCYGFPDEEGKPGCDVEYLNRVVSLTGAALRDAWESRKAARLRIATGEAKGQIAFNYYADTLYDPRCSVIQAVESESDTVIGTLVNYAIHPEVLGPKQGVVSPDLIGSLWEQIEADAGGMALFINGALGGMVTADVRDAEGTHRQTWEECERIGSLLGKEALRIVDSAPFLDDPRIACHTRRVAFPVENEGLKQIIGLSPILPPLEDDGSVVTQVNLVELGDARILTIPGEALPNIGYFLKRKLGGDHQLLFGLTNDAFGYILTKVDWNSFERYGYITRTSLGEMTGEILIEEALAMVKSLDAPSELQLPEEFNLLVNNLGGVWWGLGWQELDALELAANGAAIRVLDVAPGGPADKAGLRAGDLVTHWDGLPVTGEADRMRERVDQLAEGETVKLDVRRGAASVEVSVRAETREAYDWKKWRSDLPDFTGAKELETLFDESAIEMEALKKQFDAVRGSGASQPEK